MKSILIRELKSDDVEKIDDLLRTREELDEEGVKKRKQLMEWLAFRNPFAGGAATYFVAEDGGNIVAYLGRMPTEFIIKGRRQKGYFVHDLYVHPEYRKKGMGFFLSMSLYKAVEDSSESFCCLVWTTELNLEFQRRRGYHEMWARRYVRLINPSEKLGKFLKSKFLIFGSSLILKCALFFVNLILVGIACSEVEVKKINKFDSRFDALSENIINKINISPYRKMDYLNWKYIDRPLTRMEVLAAEKNGQILGFIVLAHPQPGSEHSEGTIVDILADPENTEVISCLCSAAIDHFKKRSVHSIDCCLTDKRFVKVFKKFLFLTASGKKPVMLANLEKCEERKLVSDIDNWHLTYGASDGFMLSA